MIALHLLGYDLDHPVMRAGLESLDRFAVWREDGARMIEACQSPVWDTCLATIALADAGLPADHPALVKAADWMLGEQIVRPGDWSVRRPELPPGGWAFEFHNDNYPDIDDTAEVVLALRRVAAPRPGAGRRGRRTRACAGTSGMQSRNGAWGAFDADNTSAFPNRLPFCDFGEVIDPPSADVTAHVVEMLAVEGTAHDPRTRRGIEWLLAEQEASGAWFGRWGVNYVYGTGSVVPALTAAGLPAAHPAIRRAVALAGVRAERRRRLGRGPALLPRRTEWIGRGASTASQTAWALLALLAAGERDGEAVERGVALARRDPAGGRLLGRAVLHRHRLPLGLLHQLPPVPAGLPAHGARPLRARGALRRPRGQPQGGLMDRSPEPPARRAAADRLRARHRAARPAQRRPHAARAAGPVTVLRTGMGPEAAERAVPGALRDGPAAATPPCVATGFCAGLAPGMHPGDLVVADETRDAARRHGLHRHRLLVKALARAVPGAPCTPARSTGSDHVVRGHERAELRATGAIAVDMESAATLRSAAARRAPPGCGRPGGRGRSRT